ncbi:MAG: hypothetical protein J6M18_02760, partial [Actinomycetaceae bacterium]|nr:hypothetical protein [Actinomycetaceae bacterium]
FFITSDDETIYRVFMYGYKDIRVLTTGARVHVRGVLSHYGGSIFFMNPEFEVVSVDEEEYRE